MMLDKFFGGDNSWRKIAMAMIPGLIFIAMGAFNLISEFAFWSKATETTTGLVTEITTKTNRRNTELTDYYADVQYEIDGVEYTKRVTCSIGNKVGDVLVLRYNPDKPHEVRTGNPRYSGGAMRLFLGGILFLIALISGMKYRNSSH